jgi:hypothetical protein
LKNLKINDKKNKKFSKVRKKKEISTEYKQTQAKAFENQKEKKKQPSSSKVFLEPPKHFSPSPSHLPSAFQRYDAFSITLYLFPSKHALNSVSSISYQISDFVFSLSSTFFIDL